MMPREAIGKFYAQHKEKGKPFTVTPFKQQIISPATIYRDIQNVDRGQALGKKAGSGSKKILLRPNSMNRLRSETVGKVAKELRPLSHMVGVSKMTVSRILTDSNITKLKRKTTPRVTPDQVIRQQSSLRKLRRKLLQSRDQSIIVMDDESYFKFCDDYYSKHYYSDRNDVDDKIRFQSREKFPQKLMIWIAISVKGRSEPYFHESKGAVNANVYINDILAKHLVPFIDKNHSGHQIIFWPDLASAHYERHAAVAARFGNPFR